jgi:hypothetical protein
MSPMRVTYFRAAPFRRRTAGWISKALPLRAFSFSRGNPSKISGFQRG